jgi:hypothetical protein
MPSLLKTFMIGLLVVAINAGCSQQMRETLSEMQDLQRTVSQRYQNEGVGINLMNGTVLDIALVNSSYNGLDQQAQRQIAKEIASWVNTQYKGNHKLSNIVITFVNHKSYFFVINVNETRSYNYKISELSPS